MFFYAMCLPVLVGCDLQPKIMALPDTVGEFITSRYPALLADPNTQPEIYNSAATDYGVYASPDLYGTEQSDDYVTYASVDDYIVPPETQDEAVDNQDNVDVEQQVDDDYLRVPMYGPVQKLDENIIVVQKGDTLYSLAGRYSTTIDELARMNNLSQPYVLSVGQKIKVPAIPQDKAVEQTKNTDQINIIAVPDKKPTGVQTTTRVELADVTVGAGDTLYSISRKYSVPVNDLAVLNGLNAPFTLAVGQKLKVPNLGAVRVAGQKVVADNTKQVANVAKVADKNAKPVPQTTKTDAVKEKAEQQQQVKQETKKISSDPKKKLPSIGARSSSKFSWPVRGKVLSAYGAKTGGLFNDGINIGASKGTAVKAAENGVVAYAGNEVKGMGNLVIIQHAGGWMTVYAHMDSMIVKRGAKVAVGQKIGTVGETGKVNKPQLHFEIRKGTQAYNPATYLKK